MSLNDSAFFSVLLVRVMFLGLISIMEGNMLLAVPPAPSRRIERSSIFMLLLLKAIQIWDTEELMHLLSTAIQMEFLVDQKKIN